MVSHQFVLIGRQAGRHFKGKVGKVDCWLPRFHLMGPMQEVGGTYWPGDLIDANAILEHRGVFHAMFMFQTPVWANWRERHGGRSTRLPRGPRAMQPACLGSRGVR